MLKTKSILAAKEESDGLRISIMSRHTLSDGKTRDERITKNSYDVWRIDFAPPSNLVGEYYRGEVDWNRFEMEYNKYLDSNLEMVKRLARKALSQDLTLLCIESSPEKCHRKLLAEKCKIVEPRLETIIN